MTNKDGLILVSGAGELSAFGDDFFQMTGNIYRARLRAERIAGLKEALEILSPDSSSAPETWAYAEAIRARISILEKGTE